MTSAIVDAFVQNGYVAIRNAIPREFVDAWWGPRKRWLDEYQDQIPWDQVGSHLYFPRRRTFSVKDIAPSVYATIDLLLGDSIIMNTEILWGDGFVVARPQPTGGPATGDQWHKDGFFRHYLDSPEIGLVALVLWTEVSGDSGPTALALDSISEVARALQKHPGGLLPETFERLLRPGWPEAFATGEAGDVYLLHPFMLHARRANRGNTWRAITNPWVPVSRPMRFDPTRRTPTPVEQVVLRSLNVAELEYLPKRDGSYLPIAEMSKRMAAIRSWLDTKIAEWEQR